MHCHTNDVNYTSRENNTKKLKDQFSINIPHVSHQTVEIHSMPSLPYVVLQVCLPVCAADVTSDRASFNISQEA